MDDLTRSVLKDRIDILTAQARKKLAAGKSIAKELDTIYDILGEMVKYIKK